MKQGTAIIIGAGPAGLTAALELERHTKIVPIVLEANREVGGLSRTIQHNGSRMDIGGHRFFSKSDRVMKWWLDLMPVEKDSGVEGQLRYRGQEREIPAAAGDPDPEDNSGNGSRDGDLVMLVRQRRSRIYFLRRFFDYPIRLTAATFRNMGLARTARCGLSYLRTALMPRREEHTLEDFLINRFGRELYLTFFKSYTEKVWGVPCDNIGAEWGAQRIKGVSLKNVVTHFVMNAFARRNPSDIAQKQTETSLIEKFLYPKFGPGQFWEHVADLVKGGGGQIVKGVSVDRVHVDGSKVLSVEGVDESGRRTVFEGDYFFSTMPVQELIRAISGGVPAEVLEVSEGLMYRDFITVGLLANKLAATDKDGSPIKDNWIYIQEPDVKVGRLQIFNNWSPWLVGNPEKIWMGLEYFCNDSDSIWKLSDEDMAKFAIAEAAKIGLLRAEDVEDFHVVRVPRTYPAYFGTYNRFEIIRKYTDSFENLFLIGRNGMHKYNNQDHSMLTAMTAVENIVNGVADKGNIWSVNTEMEYHEEK
jgi:protoporphyrinogen oxidase